MKKILVAFALALSFCFGSYANEVTGDNEATGPHSEENGSEFLELDPTITQSFTQLAMLQSDKNKTCWKNCVDNRIREQRDCCTRQNGTPGQGVCNKPDSSSKYAECLRGTTDRERACKKNC